MNTPTVTIGIPAHNEQSNIAALLSSLLTQKESGFRLVKILVVSDASTDNTVAAAQSVADPRVQVSANSARAGKVALCNEFFAGNDSDYFLQLDADIALGDDNFIATLVEKAIATNASITCPAFAPLAPRTFSERIGFFGIEWWNQILQDRSITKTMLHKCIGRARLFSKSFLKDFRFPSEVGSSEDVFAYFWAVQHGYFIACAESALALYRLPNTFRDYSKQMRRFLDTSLSMEEYFGTDVYESENQVTTRLKFKYMIKLLVSSNPLVSLTYIAWQIYAHATVRFYERQAAWDTVASTKVLK